MSVIRILPQASEELEASIFYYESKQTGLGTGFSPNSKEPVSEFLSCPRLRHYSTDIYDAGRFTIFLTRSFIEC